MTPSPRRERAGRIVFGLATGLLATACAREPARTSSASPARQPVAAPAPRAPAPGPALAPPTASVPATRPAPPPPQPPALPTESLRLGGGAILLVEPGTLRDAVDGLCREAGRGKDVELADHADLLAAMATGLAGAGDDLFVVRLPALEAEERARPGVGTAFVTFSTYFEPDAEPDALRAAYLDFDRLQEWTGKPGTRVVGREGDDVIAESDAIRRVLGTEFGARWRFRARPLSRGHARLTVTRLVDAPTNAHMLATRGVLVAFPERGGTRVAEVAASALDWTVPALLKGIATRTAFAEMRARHDGVRAHWREYRRPR